MNLIPSTFNFHQLDRTVIGGQKNPKTKMNVSAILLNSRGSHLQTQILENLINCGFKYIISVEPGVDNFNLDDVSRRYPEIKFIVPLEKSTDGEIINMCMSEIDTSYALVLRDTLHIGAGVLLQNLAENLTKSNVFCIVPRLVDSELQGLPVNIFPEADKGKFQLSHSTYYQEGLPTLYPFDYIGLYNREKFIQLGGYDYTIRSSYWQNADFAVRAWLWGEEIRLSCAFQLAYISDVPIEDTTRNLSYVQFYLKNILPSYKEDHGFVSKLSFFNFLFHSSSGFIESVSQFKVARNWVRKNQYRFKKDILNLIENWTNNK